MKQDSQFDYYSCYSKQLDELFSYEKYVSYSDLSSVSDAFQNINISKIHSLKMIFGYFIKLKITQAYKTFQFTKNIRYKLENRDRYNAIFVAQEKRKEYKLDDQKLDDQQIEAVVTCEDASLVLAPAGSGKTLSLLAKIDYLVNNLNVQQSKILAISFTRKTVKELKERVGIKGVNINTFHSLGNKILKTQLIEKSEVIQEKQIHKFVKDSLNELILNDTNFARRFNDYLLFYYSTPIDLTELKNLKDTVEFNKSFLRQSLQSISLDKKKYDINKTTIRGEWIKSKEEQIIANWLYINQIPYDYERQYKYIDTKYCPDFTITAFKEPIYLEHFALRKDGTSHFKDYVSGVEWKRKLHHDNETMLIESYTYQWNDGTLLQHIEHQIKSTGMEIIRLAEDEITKLMEGSGQYKQDITSFQEILFTFLMLQKNGMFSIEAVKEKIVMLDNEYLKRRSELFFAIYEPIYQRYEKYLKENKLIDFADMINRSIEVIEKSSEGDYPFEYILIDEVQDLSLNRYKLIKALLNKNKNSKLFAVGDDWQSIYRFAGGDLSLIQDFENTFELRTKRSVIEMTHRFGSPQLDVSSVFVQKNPYQSKKEVFGDSLKNTPIIKRFYVNNYNSGEKPLVSQESITVDDILTTLYEKYGQDLRNKTIQIISRYNWDIDNILGNSKKHILPNKNFKRVDPNKKTEDGKTDLIIEWRASSTSAPISLTFSSMHKAKGITKDIVIVLNMNSGSNGMPSIRSSDPLIEMLLSHADTYPFAEERRLFYVSITRAKEVTYVLADRSKPSEFMYEIFDDLFEGSKLCPKCQVGEVLERNGRYGKFYGCSNFRYGCQYTEKS